MSSMQLVSHDNIYDQHSLFVSSCVKGRSVQYRHILNKAPSELCRHRFVEHRCSIAPRMPTKLRLKC